MKDPHGRQRRKGGDIAASPTATGEPLKTTQKLPGGVTGKGFMPGVSGNKGGRPRGLAALARERTKDGATLIELAADLVEGKLMDVEMVFQPRKPGGQPTIIRYQQTPPLRLRLEAAQWLGDRGWGRPVQEVEVTPGRSFVVEHRAHKPGEDPLAREEQEVPLPLERRALLEGR